MSHMKDMPWYKCHKKVQALQIAMVAMLNGGGARLAFDGFNAIDVNQEWYERHKPKAGGYFVRYKDGYESYSPAEAFESGYTLFEASLGQTLYEAYLERSGETLPDGHPFPPWDDLAAECQQAWQGAAEAVIKAANQTGA